MRRSDVWNAKRPCPRHRLQFCCVRSAHHYSPACMKQCFSVFPYIHVFPLLECVGVSCGVSGCVRRCTGSRRSAAAHAQRACCETRRLCSSASGRRQGRCLLFGPRSVRVLIRYCCARCPCSRTRRHRLRAAFRLRCQRRSCSTSAVDATCGLGSLTSICLPMIRALLP